MSKPRLILPLMLIASLSLSGCDLIMQRLGIEDPAAKNSKLVADGKAVGGGCRHSGRAIEDCYAIYTWLPRESVFAGWLEMDAYMRENSIEAIVPQLPPPPPPPPPEDKKKKKTKKPAEGEKAAEGDKAAEGEKAAEPAAKH